jgi:ATP-dependent DNA ligase
MVKTAAGECEMAHTGKIFSAALANRRSASGLPQRVPPQLAQLVDAAPEGDPWLHEIRFDGYRMHARLDRGAVRLLTRTGLDWTHKYPAIAAAVASLGARQAYLDGELCGVRRQRPYPGNRRSQSAATRAGRGGKIRDGRRAADHGLRRASSRTRPAISR